MGKILVPYRIGKRNRVFLIFLALFVPLVVVFKVTLQSCNYGIQSSPRENWNEFHTGGVWKGIDRNPRGYWTGTGDLVAEYHAWHFGPKTADRLLAFFTQERANSIVDLGGGAGLHVDNFIRHGLFALCYDGNPKSQDDSNGLCATMDLTKPIKLPKFDWVLSLSVGRQIPTLLEDAFISNIHNLNRRGAVIFWGDGRPSNGLPNIKNSTQLIAIFDKLGYTNDETAGNFVQTPRDWNYRILVFRKKDPNPAPPSGDNNYTEYQILGGDLEMSVKQLNQEPPSDTDVITIALTSHGLVGMEKALTLVKSAIIFSQHTKLKAFIFVDSETIDQFKQRMKLLQQESRNVSPDYYEYEILPINFPMEIEGMASWRDVLQPSPLLRLFLPIILPHVDALIYFDTGSIILSNLTDLWNHFPSMKAQSLIGVTEEGYDLYPSKSWLRKNQIPYYGVNTRTSLMNLTRMRAENFTQLITTVRKRYETLLPNDTGDEFFENILYGFHPRYVSLIPCEWNVYCGCEECACNSSLINGVAVVVIIHGRGKAICDKNQCNPLFKNIYQTFHMYNLSVDTVNSLQERLEKQFQHENGPCFFKNSDSFYKPLNTYVSNLQSILVHA